MAPTGCSVLGGYQIPRLDSDRSYTDLQFNDSTVIYSKGIGTHADSSIVYDLNGAYTQFSSYVGVDNNAGALASVVFSVLADGVELFNSGTMTGSSTIQLVDIDITGAQQLTLVVTDSGNGKSADHANWANALLFK